MSDKFDRISDTVNVVVMPLVKGNKDDKHNIVMNDQGVYRITGDSQIEDMEKTGYVRSRENGQHGKQVYWTQGRKDYALGPAENNVIVAPSEKLQTGHVGAISIFDILHIWKWNKETDTYIDRLDEVIERYNKNQEEEFEME